MRIKSENKRTITIVLNEEEAQWLARIMQNPIYGQTPAEEDRTDAGMREELFTTLTEHLK